MAMFKEGGVYVESPVHAAFGLTYSAYFCVPRLVLEHMPLDWQRKFLALMKDLPDTPTYSVQRVGENGKFVKDDLRDYRRGTIPVEMAEHIFDLIEK